MPVGDVNPSSFDAYEGIRIVIPGAIVVSCYAAVTETFSTTSFSPSSNLLGGVVASLLIGLVLLFIDLPRKSAQYLNPQIPTQELWRWNVKSDLYDNYLSLYLVMLDLSFPATIRNRALYMGSIFRIGLEGIYLVGLTAVGALAASAAFPNLGPTRHGTASTRVILVCAAGAHALVFIGACFARFEYRQTRRGGGYDKKSAANAVASELFHEIGPVGAAGLLVPVWMYPMFVGTHDRIALLSAVLAPSAAWAIVYFRGRPEWNETIRAASHLSPPSSVLLYGVPVSLAAIGLSLRDVHGSAFNTSAALAWGAATLAPALLMLTRGHERKLNGSFTAQTNWMRANKASLIRKYRLKPRAVGTSTAANSPNPQAAP